MSSTDELLREKEVDTATQSEPHTSRRDRLAARVRSVFSPKYFGLALVVIAVGLFVAGSIPLLSFIPGIGLAGIFVAAFALGVLGSEQHYPEIGVAGGVVSGVSLLTSFTVLVVADRFGIGLVAVAGAVIGALVALVGHYFGRDLRAGVTKDIE